MSPELTRQLMTAIDRMPAFPKSVQQVLELTRDLNCAPRDLVQVIERDPVLTVKILKVVNSAYFGLSRPVTSVNHAVVFLGFNTIKNLALSIAAIGILPSHNPAGFDIDQYLLHSLSTAGIARKLARQLDDIDPMDGYIAGLLHDFGKIVLAQYLPEAFGKAMQISRSGAVSLHQALRETIGIDHASVGALLVEKWRFPASLVSSITHPSDPDAQDTDLSACVFAANQISKKAQHGFAGNRVVEALPATMQKRLGGDLDGLTQGLGDLQPLLEEARLFARV